MRRISSIFIELRWDLFFGCVVMLMASVPAQAFLELNLHYTGDGMTASSTSASSRTFIEGTLGFAIDKKGEYLVGWNYSSMATSDQMGTSTTTYASTQMGPRFLFVFGRERSWSLGLGYYLVTSAAVNSGSSNDKWEGTALKADFGYNIPVAELVYAGIRLNYSSASYTENFVGGTSYTQVSYSKTATYPSVYLFYMF